MERFLWEPSLGTCPSLSRGFAFTVLQYVIPSFQNSAGFVPRVPLATREGCSVCRGTWSQTAGCASCRVPCGCKSRDVDLSQVHCGLEFAIPTPYALCGHNSRGLQSTVSQLRGGRGRVIQGPVSRTARMVKYGNACTLVSVRTVWPVAHPGH